MPPTSRKVSLEVLASNSQHVDLQVSWFCLSLSILSKIIFYPETIFFSDSVKKREEGNIMHAPLLAQVALFSSLSIQVYIVLCT